MDKQNKKILSMFLASCMIVNNFFPIVSMAEQGIAENQEPEKVQETVLEDSNKKMQQDTSPEEEKDKENKTSSEEEKSDAKEKATEKSSDNIQQEAKQSEKVQDEQNKEQEENKDEKNQKNEAQDRVNENDSIKALDKILSQSDTQLLYDKTLSDKQDKMNYGLEISGVAEGTVGDDLASRNTLQISLVNNTDKKLFDITSQNIYKITVDDREISFYDTKNGHRTFVLVGNDYMTFEDNDYVDGTAAIQDFRQREKHKVVIIFRDGSYIKYEDDAYVIPDGRVDTTPKESSQGGEQTPKTGIASKYKIAKVEVDDELHITFEPKDIQAYVKGIKSAKINGKLYNKPENSALFFWNRAHDNIDTNPFVKGAKDILEVAKSKNPVEIELTFADDSKLRNYTEESTNPALPPVENPFGPRKVKGYILTKKGTKYNNTSVLNKALAEKISIDPTDRIIGFFPAHEVTIKFDEVDIKGEKAKVSKLKYIAMGKEYEAKKVSAEKSVFKFDIPQIAIKPDTSDEDFDLDIIVELDKQIEGYKNPTDKLMLKFDYNSNFISPSIEDLNNSQDPQVPTEKLGEIYEIKDIIFKDSESDNPKRMVIQFKKDIKPEHISQISSIKINNKVYDNDGWNYPVIAEGTDGIYISDKNQLERAKDKKNLEIMISFKDGSEINFSKEIDIPQTNIGSEYKIKETKIEQGYVREDFVIYLDKTISNEHVNKISSVNINGQAFDAEEYEFYKHRSGGIHSDNKDVVEKVKAIEKAYENLTVEIVFKDDTKIVYSKDNTKPVPPIVEPPKTGIVKNMNYEIQTVSVDADTLVVNFNKQVYEMHSQYIKNIIVNGQTFEKASAALRWENGGTVLKTSKAEIVAKAKEKTPIQIAVTFADNSQATKNIAYVEEKLTLESELEDGDYTLTYKAYVKDSNKTELSTFNGYFDKKVKLHVENGKKTISFLNYLYADLMLDFAMEIDGSFKSFEKQEIPSVAKASDKYGIYKIEVDDLKVTKNASILGKGPMGGSESDIGHYDNVNYKKLEIVFDNEVIKNWTDYKIVEEIKEKKEKNDEILTQALIGMGIDTNEDKKISPDELRAAKGEKKKKSIEIDGFPSNNVIDLENLGITDISILKDLGPNIKAININGNKIESLPVFEYATGVTHLCLGANNISDLDKDTFKNMPKLKYIDFDSNPLGTLPKGIFDNNPELSELALMNTRLESVPDDLIKNNTKLENLYLYDNNIKTLADDFFSQNPYLRKLVIWNNNLESLPSSLGENKRFLSIIYANDNNITKIPETFVNLKLLSELYLSNNRISEIPDELFTNLIKYSKIRNIQLDLKANNLRRLPVDAMLNALDTGDSINNFKVNLNYLPTQVSVDEIEKLKQIGIYFDESGGQDPYYPQKDSIGATATAKDGKINLSQKFDILEFYYWDLGDSSYYGGKEIFNSEKEFYNYLMGAGRDQNRVKRSLDRDEAIREILSNKKLTWKVETTITKNNGNQVYHDMSKENQKEGQNQEFTDSSMKMGDKYTLTKALYIEKLGWHRVIEYSVDFVAGEVKEDKDTDKVKVKLYQKGKNELSMANDTLKPTAMLKEENGKFKYTLFFKPMDINGLKGEIAKLSVDINGKFVDIEAKDEQGEYPKSYTFELDKKVDRLTLKFEVKGMSQAMQADVVFEYVKVQDENVVNGHILTADGSSVSMADKFLDRNIRFKKIDKKAGPFDLVEFTVKFNELPVRNVNSGVESFAIKLKDTWMYAKEVPGQKGTFTFEMLESALKSKDSIKDTIFSIKFKTYPTVSGHESEREAKLLLDWNNDFNGVINPPVNPPVPPTNPNLQDGVYDVEVSINQAGTNNPSAANQAIVREAKVEKIGNQYKYTITFKPMEMMGQKGNITQFAIMKNGAKTDVPLTNVGENKLAVFTLDKAVEKLRVYVQADIMQKMGMGMQQADLIINWKGKNIADKEESKEDKKQIVEVTTKEEVKENKVITTVEVEQNKVTEAIAEIEKNNKNSATKKDTLQIQVKKSEQADIKKQESKVSLAKDVLEKIADKKEIQKLELKTPQATVRIPSKVIEQLKEESDKSSSSKIEVSIKRVEDEVLQNLAEDFKKKIADRPIVDINIVKENGEKITNFNQAMEVSIAYDKKSHEDSSRIKAYYIDDNNNSTKLESRYDEAKKAVIFTTTHFSKYAVGYEESAGSDFGRGGGGGSSASMADGRYTVNVWLKQVDSDEASMADKALSRTATVVKSGNTYKYTVRFNSIEVLGKVGKITKLSIDKNGSREIIQENDGEYTFELNKKVNELLVHFEADIMKAMNMGEKSAVIVFDWDGTKPAPAQSAKIETDLSVKAVQLDGKEESILNTSLNKKAKLIEENGKYSYQVEFKDVVQGDKTAKISSLNLIINDYESKTITAVDIDSSDYKKSYTFVLDEKKDKIKISFKLDGIETTEKEAYLVFEEKSEQKKESADTLKQKVEKILSKEQSSFYSKETIKAVEKAYDAYMKKQKNAKEDLIKVLENARIEKINHILKDGYMSGLPGNKFMPNKNISIAEASVMFAQLIDEDVSNMKKAVIKDKTWYSEAVNKLVELEYIKLKKDEKLDVNRAITRAEYAYIVAKLRNYPTSKKSFSDVSKDYWASDAISSLAEKKVINGYVDGTFKPENNISRAEAVVMVSRAFPTTVDISKKTKFVDVKENHWAYKYIMSARKNDIKK